MTNDVHFSRPKPEALFFVSQGVEMLRVSRDGFYVRGVKLEQDESEARLVWEALVEWLKAHGNYPR